VIHKIISQTSVSVTDKCLLLSLSFAFVSIMFVKSMPSNILFMVFTFFLGILFDKVVDQAVLLK